MKTSCKPIIKLVFVGLLVALLFTATAMAQDYYSTQSVQQTTDGGYIVTGSTSSYRQNPHPHSGSDAYLIKTDASGNMEWQKTFGGNWDNYGSAVQQTTDGGYIIVGDTKSYGVDGEDVYLIKTDASGKIQWQKTYGGTGGDLGYSVRQTTDGGYIVTGSTRYYSGFDVLLIKTDASGNVQWEKTFGGDMQSISRESYGGFPSWELNPPLGAVISLPPSRLQGVSLNLMILSTGTPT